MLRHLLPSGPPRDHTAVVQAMMDDTDLLTRMGELDEAATHLLTARQIAFERKLDAAEADQQFDLAEAEIVLDGLSGSNERERKADFTKARTQHPTYARWLQLQQAAADAAHYAENAQTRYDTAKAILRAAAAAVGALGGGL